MLTKMATQGALDACAAFGVDPEKLAAGGASWMSSVLPKAQAFGQGQWNAAKSLFHNARGGLGGKFSPDFKGSLDPSHAELGRASHRAMAMQSLKTLAPTLAVAGGLGYLHHRNKQQELQQQQQLAAQGAY